ncbi:glycerate kinase [Pseudonocardia thermophila]|uniref:Glycerate kinase n=1 Tax=Pseudonocardia thermophila TaxID=1848 RepID=A0A1M6UF73_PSETH|nr:glycerate kinase [Pseudonocardia thermophila]SHK67827.1 glycerate kinase [Pseudonocardia thermophila]
MTVDEDADGPRVLVAPDKFKGSLTAAEAARAIADGVRAALPGSRVIELPVADGGEGTVDAVVAAGGTRHVVAVTGPTGAPVDAAWAALGEVAVVELAAADGLQLLRPTRTTALTAGSSGTGEVVRAALDAGFRRIVIGLGGSSGTDGGTGLLTSLGARFLDADGRPVPPGGGSLRRIAEVDLDALDPRLAEADVVVCCDVEVPLTGERGAAALFGPQKGAAREDVAELDAGLAHLAEVLHAVTGRDAAAVAWGGAAGGVSGGLYAALGARFTPGADYVVTLLGLDDRLAEADLVVVGEGRMDRTSLTGKAPVEVVRRAVAAGVAAVAVVGALALTEDEVAAAGLRAVRSAVDEAGSAAEALTRPEHWVRAAAETVARTAVENELVVIEEPR